MKPKDFRQLYLRVGAEMGWDFSRLNYTSEGVKWNFYREVSRKLSADSLWLDLGCGGGEKILRLVPRVQLLVGIDYSDTMVETARKNLAASDAANARFFVMDTGDLQFPDGFFDIVTARHCDFSPAEAGRVLRSGGTFMTQQVDIDDKANLVELFDRGERAGLESPLGEYYARQLEAHGFKDVELDYYDADEYFHSVEDLLFLLKNTPIVPGFGKPGDFELFEKFVQENTTERGIITNAHRSLITARKK